jgi:hypothetical protein
LVALLAWPCAAVSASPAGSAPEGLYSLADEGAYNRFTNNVKGYSLLVGKSMSVDMSLSGVAATLESPDVRIRIFTQSLGEVSRASYQAYSNGFLNNAVDHVLEYQGYQDIGGWNAYITQWYRGKLLRVANDKNYYVCIDVPINAGEVLTIFMSASQPIYLSGGYAYLIEGLKLCEKTAPPYVRKAAPGDKRARGWNAETQTFFDHYFNAAAPLAWGIFEPTFPQFTYYLRDIETQVGYTFPVTLNYSGFENKTMHSELDARLRAAHAEGKTLELTLQTSAAAEGESNQVYQVLNGEYDEFLRNYAKSVASFGHPVLFRLGNEMNGDWCPYSGYNTSRDPSVFVEFYKYVYDHFKREGAANVIWVWNPNGKSFPDFDWNNELMYYPGDDLVDVVGLTAYNTGNYYPGETWKSFAELYDNLYYPYLEKYDKPFMITEFSCAQLGGDKAQWIRDMFVHIKYYDRIKMAVWWNAADYDAYGNISRSYFINAPYSLTKIFRENLNGASPARPADVSWKESVFA